MSRANRSRDEGERINLAALQESVTECVHFILCQETGKTPIKRLDIAKHLSTVCRTPSNQIETVITEADKILKMVYGYKLEPVENKNKQYIVVLNEACEFTQLPVHEDDNNRRMLIAALTHIFMSGAPVREDNMWRFLHDADILKIDDIANRKILTNTFKKQLYLQYEKIPCTAAQQIQKYEFKWGERAVKEVSKIFLLNKVAEALEKTPNHWAEQYKEATEES